LEEQIKASFSPEGRHKKFWDELSANPIYPIDSTEAEGSDLAEADAKSFYAVCAETDALATQHMTEAVEEDLFDDLE
jgi:hypothetical protein